MKKLSYLLIAKKIPRVVYYPNGKLSVISIFWLVEVLPQAGY